MSPRTDLRIAVATSTLGSQLEADESGLPACPDQDEAIARLGSELAALTSDVSRREEALHRLARQIAVERNQLLDGVLNRIFDGFAGFIPFDHILCLFLAENGAAAVTYWMRAYGSTMTLPSGYTSPIADSGFFELMDSDDPLVIDDLPGLVRQRPAGDLLQRLVDDGVRSSLTCPLVADGAPLGFLIFASMDAGVYRQGHVTAFQRLAGQVAVVVQKTRAYGFGITQARRLMAERRRLEEAANTDALTGVLNRRALDQALTAAWRRHEQGNGAFGIILCDVDHFKDVNDQHGHAVGDIVLAGTARRMAEGLRGNDIFGRFGGEEFLVIIHTDDERRLLEVADRLRRRVAGAPFAGVPATASFGVALASQCQSLDELFVAADHALYAAKRQGRNCCVLAA